MLKSMLDQAFVSMAQKIVRQHFSVKNKAFIFGSALRKKDFHDVDIAILGVEDKDQLLQLKQAFEQSDFPRPVDIIDFDHADKDFQSYVLNKEKKQWI